MRTLHASITASQLSEEKGFTLIELMITVAIVAIIAAVALPAYNSEVRKTRRSDAMTTLSQDQTVIERCYAANFTYAVPPCTAPSATSLQGYYTISSTITATTYALTATATGPQVADTTCSTMSVNQANVQSATNSSGTAQTGCWTQ